MGKNTTQKVEITLRFEPGRAKQFNNVREYVQHRIREAKRFGKDEHIIAAEMDLSPSDLSRKLYENKGDSRRFNTRDLEAYMQSQLDYEPIYYLVEKYLVPRNDDEIRSHIKRLQAMLTDN